MKIIKVKDKQEGSKVAFEIIEEAMQANNHSLHLGLATGSTPEPLYQEMIESPLDFSKSVGINLDEYVGLKANHPQSYHHYMEEKLFSKKSFKETFLPDGMQEEDIATKEYDEVLEKYPIDIQILGIGTNGHIGFNEPGTSFDSTTHKVALTQETIEANQRFFETKGEVPKEAYTMGIKSILQADKIILMAYGKEKAEAVALSLEGPVTEEVPASALQKHGNVTCILDEEAAEKLNNL